MFNTFALTLRPDEIRVFFVVLAAVVSATLAVVARSLGTMLARASERGRSGILSPLDRLVSGPISVARPASPPRNAATLECDWILDRAGRLMCRWTRRSRLLPPH